MFILDMLRSGEIHFGLFNIFLWNLGILISTIILARKKAYRWWVAGLFGMIPFINLFALIVYVGIPPKSSSQLSREG